MQTNFTNHPNPETFRQEILAWLKFAHTPHLSLSKKNQLIRRYTNIQDIFQTPPKVLAQLIHEAFTQALFGQTNPTVLEMHAYLCDWLKHPSHHFLHGHHPLYPSILHQLYDPPLYLHANGIVSLLQSSCLAIVGSRNATPQGLENAQYFAQSLSQAGLTIVSGMALGIDGAAHRGALNKQGKTIAIIGTGIDRIYPARHFALHEEICQQGLILSEWALGTPARASHFPQRNRLIAGLSKGVLVVEASTRSGSLITANLANEFGRDIFAIPGSIHSPLTKGCHKLIQEGALLVEKPEDILYALGYLQEKKSAQNSPEAKHTLSAKAQQLIDLIGFDPCHIETILSKTTLTPSELYSELLDLELKSMIKILPGEYFLRNVKLS